MWEKEKELKISGMMRKIISISIKFDLHEVCLSYTIYCLIFYFVTILTPFFSPDLWHLSHQGRGVQEVLTTGTRVGRGQGYR